MLNKFNIIVRVTLSLASLTMLASCTPEVSQDVIAAIPVVKIVDVSRKTSTLHQFPAEIEANQDSHLAFRVSGELKQFLVKAGNRVTKGQLLAQLDPTDFQIQLNERKARHGLAKAQFERAKQLLAKRLTSQAEFDQAKANLLVARSTLRSAQTALAYTSLRAPYDGVVAKVYADNLENVQAQQVILNMQNSDSVDVSIQVSEHVMANIDKKTEYQPTMTFDFDPKRKHILTIKEWDAQADLLTRTYKVVFNMPIPADANILPGMTGTVWVEMAKVTKLATATDNRVVPVAAVFSAEDLPLSANKRFVWQVLPDMTVTRVAVEVGEISGQGIEIISGLQGDEKIVGAGVHFISEGMTVRRWVRERGL